MKDMKTTRTMKIRAWDKKRLVMVEVALIDFNEKYLVVGGGYEWNEDPETGEAECVVNLSDAELMQFTGLTDKNGREVFEGDIADIRYQGGGHTEDMVTPCVCVYGISGIPTPYGYERYVGFYFEQIGGPNNFTLFQKPFEVIGNVWENPELLKEEVSSNT